MKVLVIGGGGREHALIWALAKSARVTELVCAPGNAGIARIARCLALENASVLKISAAVHAEAPQLVVIGPEVPLAQGVVDELQRAGFRVFGPTQAAAQLESSKEYAKSFMARWQIPTARYIACRSLDEVRDAVPQFHSGIVVKADGLAAGKGVVVCSLPEEAIAAAREMFAGPIGATTLVLEEALTGPEVSFFALCDGKSAVALAAAQDHKRIGEDDTGPNTGGMGAYSTDSLLSVETERWMLEEVAQRVVDGMAADGVPFAGVLFCGFMLTRDGPKVLEFNTRFGDPETEAMLLRLDMDFLDVLEAVVDGRVSELRLALKAGASACVVAASEGYPGSYPAGRVIAGLDAVAGDVQVFHAGTALVGDQVVTAGGRVLAVSAAGEDLDEALAKCYRALERISFEGMYYRRDIGRNALENG